MYPAPFTYLAPGDLAEVLALLEEYRDDATLLGGGQTLVAMMALRLATPEVLIDLGRLPRARIRVEGDHLVIPGGTRHAEILREPLVAEHAPMMATAAGHIGNVRVRNRGTIGGSLAHADPSAEWPVVVTALGGVVRLTSVAGTRNVPAAAFFEAFMTTGREPNEVITEIRVPLAGSRGQAFVELTRRANDFAVVEVAAVVSIDRRGALKDVSLVAGGVAERPVGLDKQERSALRGLLPDDPAIGDAVESFVARLEPHDDVHGSSGYRRHLARTLSRQALAAAAAR